MRGLEDRSLCARAWQEGREVRSRFSGWMFMREEGGFVWLALLEGLVVEFVGGLVACREVILVL